MRKIFFLFAMLCSMVLLATPLEPKVKRIDATSVCIYWDSYGTYSKRYRVPKYLSNVVKHILFKQQVK